MKLESLRCIVRRLEKVVVVRPTYVLFSLETISQGTFEHIYDVCPSKKFSGREELLEIITLEVLNLL